MTDAPTPPPGGPPPGATPPPGPPPGPYQAGPAYPPAGYQPGAYQPAGYQPGYAGAPMAAPASNGMAVAALVFGILTYVCLGPIAAILAIIFGFVGLSKSRETNVGRGMSIAGIALGGVGLVLGTVLFILLIALGSTTSSNLGNIGGPADTSAYQTTPGNCSVSSSGVATFSGTIRNTSSSKKNFTVHGAFHNKANNALIDNSSDLVTDIPSGGSAPFTITSTQASSEMQISCNITEVDNWFN